MHFLSETDRNLLLLLQDSIKKIMDYIADHETLASFSKDKESYDAILMNFIVIGELAGRLSLPFRTAYGHIPWTRIKDLRNIIAHDYFNVETELIWEIIHSKIINLLAEIEQILEA